MNPVIQGLMSELLLLNALTRKREDAAQHEVGYGITCFSLKSSLEDYITPTCLRVASDFSFNFMFPLEDTVVLFLRTLLLEFILTEDFPYERI